MNDRDVVSAGLANVRECIERAAKASGRTPEAITLVAVTKRQAPSKLEAAFELGQRHFGENYVQELEKKRSTFPEAIWHLIGHLQTNKAKLAAKDADLIHTIDSLRIAKAIDSAAGSLEKKVEVLVQVNISEESQKSGVAPADTEALVEGLRSFSNLRLRGLMCIPSQEGDPSRWFAALRTLRDQLAERSGLTLQDLSMGMSGDFESAIREGATIVRVGTAIFGERGS